MIITYKTIRWAALLLAILMLCTACSTKGNDEESTTPPVESGAEETTDAVTEAPKEMLTIAEKSKTEFGVILPDEANGAYLSLFSSFLRAFKEKYGALIVSTSDLMSQIRPSAPGTKEIILGNTVKAETAELNAMLSSAGGNRFGILVTDCKIIINGTSAYQCYLALDYFFSQFTSVDANGDPMASVESGFAYISADTEDHRYTIEELLGSGREIAFAATEKVLRFQTKNGASTPQGGCTDGTYVYVGMMGSADGQDYGVVVKYDLSSGALLGYSEKLPLFHNNDLTYDAKHHRLVVATLDEGWKKISFVDPDTLQYIGDTLAPVGIRGIEYLPESNTYVAASHNVEIMILDENFNKISSHICADTTLMTQGLYSDGKYVYDPRFLDGKSTHLVVVEDMAGKLLSSAQLYGLANTEPEHMFALDGQLYIGCNHSGWLYAVEVVPQNWW